MKLSSKLKALCAAFAVTAAGAASATPFYLDVGTNFGPAGGQACPTCTSVKDEFLFAYQSKTSIIDVNNNHTIDAGDLVFTNVGLSVGGIGNNAITNFNPVQVLNNNSNNGYGSNYLVTFRADNLAGVVSGVTGAGVPLFNYGPGLLKLFLTFDGTTLNNFMNIDITGGGATGLGTVLFGKVGFAGTDAGFRNLFHSASGPTCGGLTGFFDLVSCNPSIRIDFEASQDSNVLLSQFALIGQDADGHDIFSVTTNHDGSGTFNIPEPSMLLLLGGALLGMGYSNRRRANRQA